MTKLFIFFLTICLIDIATLAEDSSENDEEYKSELIKLTEKCRDSVGAAPDDVGDLLNNNPAKTKAEKALHACVFKGLNLVDSEGKFHREVFQVYAKKYANGCKQYIAISMKAFDICSQLEFTGDLIEDVDKLRLCMKKEGEQLKKVTQD